MPNELDKNEKHTQHSASQGAKLWVESPKVVCVLSALAHSSIIPRASYYYTPSAYLITSKP